jgi:hypothetical protein
MYAFAIAADDDCSRADFVRLRVELLELHAPSI